MNSDSAQTTRLSRKTAHKFIEDNFPGDTSIFRIELQLDRYTVWRYRLDDEGRMRTEQNRFGQRAPLVKHEELFYA